MIQVAVIGAGGKIGMRISRNLFDNTEYEVVGVEKNEAAVVQLKNIGIRIESLEDALESARIVVLALPDTVIPSFAEQNNSLFAPGSLIVGLDPAVAYANKLPSNETVSHVVIHPCHPALFHDDFSLGAQTDWFGGIAEQDVVCTLFKGSENDYSMGEQLARCMFNPVRNVYRLTIEQMAIMEPGVVEICNQTFIHAMKETLDESIKMGVPEEAARAFVLGHIRVQLAVIFGFAGFPFSDGAMKAMKDAQSKIFQDNWKEKIFTIENIRKTVDLITSP